RPDAIVPARSTDGGALRERLAAELATRTAQAPVVLVELDDDLAGRELGLADLADSVLIRMNGRPPLHRGTEVRRVALVHENGSGPRPALGANHVVAVPGDGPGRRRALARLARYLTRRSIGVALGSGAAWGLAHIGVLEVLDQERIPVDVI